MSAIVSRRLLALSRAPALARTFAVGLKDRERAAEAVYFNREEEQLLKKLLNKMRAPAPGTGKSEEAKRLDAIVDKYKVSEADKAALLEWRHSHEF